MTKYPAKLLLFGEYGLMFGAKALAVPFPKFSGHFTQFDLNSSSDSQQESATELQRFARWFEQEEVASQMNFPLDAAKLNVDLKNGLYFESDVPLQYGVGSSGALCAALYDCYSVFSAAAGFNPVTDPDLRLRLKQDFVLLESYFHGRSSGLDPLVAFLNHPVLLTDGQIELPELSLDDLPWSVFLIDTRITGATSPLVKTFITKMEDDQFSQRFRDYYLPANDGAIHAFQNQDEEQFFTHLATISQFQLDYFQEMLPESSMEFIHDLRKKGIFVKLLGSGGGGFLLAFVPGGIEFPETKDSFRIF